MQRTNYLSQGNAAICSTPLSWHLPATELPNACGGFSQRGSCIDGQLVPRSLHFLGSHVQALPIRQCIPTAGVLAQCAITVATHVLNNRLHPGVFGRSFLASSGKFTDSPQRRLALEYTHHTTTLFSGYSTMP